MSPRVASERKKSDMNGCLKQILLFIYKTSTEEVSVR